jgi:mRNA interferase MazF
VRAENTFDIPVQDWQPVKLLKPSVVKPVIATVEQGLVIKRLGRLTEKDRHALVEGLRRVLG